MSYEKNHQQWLTKCRTVLIEMETKNIRQRALSWTEIVNTETLRINGLLRINLSNYLSSTATDDHLSYAYTVANPIKYLPFLSEWNGIKTRNTSSCPTSYIEFEAKAKNWLNGRRAPNYGNTLFVEMMQSAEQYAKHLGTIIFSTSPLLNNQYSKCLLFSFLSKLCSVRIAVHQSWKKTNILCENSVKNMHTKTAKLLQQYAIHDYVGNDLKTFPGNLQRATAFFQHQAQQYLSRLIASYSAHSNVSSTSQSIQPMRDCNDGYVSIKGSDFQQILSRLNALEQNHSSQANQISNLTSKCLQLQSHIDAATKGQMQTHLRPYDALSANDQSINTAQSQSIETPIMHSAVPFIASNANMSPMVMPTAQMQLPLPSVFAYQQPNVQKQPFYDAQTVFSTAHPMEFRGNYSDVHNQSMSAYQVVASPRDHLMFDETATCATPNANMNMNNEERFTCCHSPMNYQ